MKLADIRKKYGFTQNYLAKILNLNVTSIGKWENGKAYPRRATLRKLAEIFNISESAILQAIDNSKE